MCVCTVSKKEKENAVSCQEQIPVSLSLYRRMERYESSLGTTHL
jgi:hypothetical protein